MVNAVSSATASTNLAAGKDNLKVGYDTFLKLLTTQLRNQDPTSPLDTNQFTTQLVQMTGVQQQLLSNELLQTLIDKTSASGGVGEAARLIGQTVHATGGTAQLDGGEAKFAYGLATGAANATLTIKNAQGQVVWTGAAPNLSQGRHDFTWDGKTTAGTRLADGGLYTLSVSATDAAGKAVQSATEVTGVVTAVETVDGATVLNLGKTKVLYSAVNRVGAAASDTPIAPISPTQGG